MHRRFIANIGLLLLIAIIPAFAAGGNDIPPLEERVRETQLDNGLKVVVVERHATPVFFSLISFRVGSTIEEMGKSGLSHFMEHMLFKGSETIGTTDFSKEKPIMEELEQVATDMRDLRVSLDKWRYAMFEEYMGKVRAELASQLGPDQQNEAAIWDAVLEKLPRRTAQLPEEWHSTSWVYEEDNHNYWKDYRTIIKYRKRMAELLAEQRQYIQQSAIDKIYSAHGNQMLNAGTSYDGTFYMTNMPSNCLELWMYIESDRFKNPVFREFYSERSVVQEELLGHENNPDRNLMHETMKAAFVAHPYGRPIIGWREEIQLTLRSEMDAHYHRYYAPNNCQVTIVGDVNSDEVFAMAEEYFGDWEPGEVAHEVLVKEPDQKGERRIEVEFDASPRVMVTWHVPVAPHPDAYALSMLRSVLSFGKTSRFYKNIYEGKQLTASAPGVSSGPGDRYPGVLFVYAEPNAQHSLEEVEQAVYAEIDDLKNELVSDYELEKIHNQYKAFQLKRLRSNQWLAFTLSGGFVDRGDWRTVVTDYERLLKVTPEDIKRVANKYLVKKQRTVAYMVNPDAEETEQNQNMGAQQ